MSDFGELEATIRELPEFAVAVSGGVDSMTLALFGHSVRDDVQMFHAISPAVPSQATDRVRTYAAQNGWHLTEIRAGEFDDPNYLANPYDRCLYCKTNLYAEIRKHTGRLIVSGANVDDLSDYRPGLTAAERYGVRHPYVEAGIDKRGVRALAASLGASDLADLPASPCLSSRVETGIPIDADALLAINRVERYLQRATGGRTVRCRLRRNTLTLELDAESLSSLTTDDRRRIREHVLDEFAGSKLRQLEFSEYRMGSAFIAERESA